MKSFIILSLDAKQKRGIIIAMSIELIKDGNGQIIGSQNGDWVRDRSGKQIARFNTGTNQTISVKGQRYGTGDQRIGALKELGNKKK